MLDDRTAGFELIWATPHALGASRCLVRNTVRCHQAGGPKNIICAVLPNTSIFVAVEGDAASHRAVNP